MPDSRHETPTRPSPDPDAPRGRSFPTLDSPTYDVIVVGTGIAGTAAAVEAAESGARVLLVDKAPPERAGGNTRLSGGAWFHHDDPVRAAAYLRALCGTRPLPEEIVAVWAEHTQFVSAWFTEHGIAVETFGDFGAEYPELDGSDCYGGYRCVEGRLGSMTLFTALQTLLATTDIEIRHDFDVTALLTDDTGRVVGVAERSGVQAHATGGVVLATGGFEADPDLVSEHLGLSDVSLWGSADATGDGLRLAQRVGADLWHMDNMMAVTGITPPGSRHGFFFALMAGGGAIWVDESGRRFIDETAPSGHGQALIDGEYVLKPDRPMYVIFDENTRLAGPVSPGPQMLDVGWNVVMERYMWSADNSAEIAAGWISTAADLDGIAAAIGVDAATLRATVDDYNETCAAGTDPAFDRAPQTLVPLTRAPFYAFATRPMLAWTNGGPRRDEHSRVLRADGEPIAGLYAAGTVSSTYSWAKDGGFHIADGVVFGRIAGARAAHAAQEARTAASVFG